MIKCIIFLLSCCLVTAASAQKTNEILVVSPRGEEKATHLVDAIRSDYTGVVTVVTELPVSLDYDAVMMLYAPHKIEDLIDSIQQERLINYIKSGGRFYAEGVGFRGEMAKATYFQLWNFIGDTQEIATASFVYVNSVRGVEGEFTDGLSYLHKYNPNGDAGTGFYIDGMKAVLVTDGGMALASISEDLQIKAILHTPIVSEHYNDFIARVVCTYFQLCILDVPSLPVEQAKIVFDPVTRELSFPTEVTLEVFDILGRDVLGRMDVSNRFILPHSLVSGTYLVKWQSIDSESSSLIIVP